MRKALDLLLDRGSIQKFIYGRGGVATANFVNNPQRFVSKTTKFEYNVAKANEVLEGAGWKKGADGIRAKDGKQLKYVFQTSINQPRQKTQQVFKQSCQQAGIELELKQVTASVYFSSDVANPDTYTKFYTDLQMYNTNPNRPDPGVFLQFFLSTEAASKANKWQGRNITRWQNPAYDKLYATSIAEVDPIKRAQILIDCNNMGVENNVVIPVCYRPGVQGVNLKLRTVPSGFDSDVWNVADWYRET